MLAALDVVDMFTTTAKAFAPGVAAVGSKVHSESAGFPEQPKVTVAL
jgi:hypothetical protein